MEKQNLISGEYAGIYAAGREPSMVMVPGLSAFAVDGDGDPRDSVSFQAATAALYACAYGLKMGMKKAGIADWAVMPLEGEWWSDDMARFSMDDRGAWKWTLLIVQPPSVPDDAAVAAIEAAKAKKGFVEAVRFERRPAYEAARILHVGPYADEAPTIARLHAYIEASGRSLTGKHREIYLGDPRRTAPERLKTILVQPVA